MNSLDGPECRHGHSLFNPNPCVKCLQEQLAFTRCERDLALETLKATQKLVSEYANREVRNPIVILNKDIPTK